MPMRLPRRPRYRHSGTRGGVLAWLAGGLVFLAAAATLAWMLLLPVAVQSRFSAATGAQLLVRGLMGDPFSGRATVTGWTLNANASPGSRVLARGGASKIVAPDWQAALAAEPGGTAVIDSLDLAVTEAVLAPDAKGAWPLLSLAAAAGLPYEKDGPSGDGPRVKIKHLRLAVETVVVRDARTGRDTPVRIAWHGEFQNLGNTKPVLTALLAAVREAPAGAPPR